MSDLSIGVVLPSLTTQRRQGLDLVAADGWFPSLVSSATVRAGACRLAELTSKPCTVAVGASARTSSSMCRPAQDLAGDPAALNHGFGISMLICAALFLLGSASLSGSTFPQAH